MTVIPFAICLKEPPNLYRDEFQRIAKRPEPTKIETTTKYYIGENEIATDKMKEALEVL